MISMARFESMRTILLFTVLALLFELSTCRPANTRALSDNSTFWSRQNGGVFSVLGVVAFGDGTPHPRLEIRELEKDKDQWNVFMLGIRRFQNIDQNDKLSYFKVAGESILLYLQIKHAWFSHSRRHTRQRRERLTPLRCITTT